MPRVDHHISTAGMWQAGQLTAGLTPSWRLCAATPYLSAAWHCRQTPSPGTELGAVRIVTVAAGDALGEHLALLERAVVVDLILHLPVGEIEALGCSPATRYAYRTAILSGTQSSEIVSAARVDKSPHVSTSLRKVAGVVAARSHCRSQDRSSRTAFLCLSKSTIRPLEPPVLVQKAASRGWA